MSKWIFDDAHGTLIRVLEHRTHLLSRREEEDEKNTGELKKIFGEVVDVPIVLENGIGFAIVKFVKNNGYGNMEMNLIALVNLKDQIVKGDKVIIREFNVYYSQQISSHFYIAEKAS